MSNKPPKPKKTICPLSRPEFLEKAKALAITIDGVAMQAPPREFSTGSLGWNLNNKTTMDIGGTSVMVQIGMNVTLVGSKDLPGRKPAEGEAGNDDAPAS